MPDTPVAPETTPVADPTVATDETLLVHVPPGEVLLNVVVEPAHTEAVPLILAGVAVTVSVVTV